VAVGDDAGDGRQEDGWREEGDRGEDGGELRDAAVRGVMVALVQALERVLLDGGPRRVFVPGDGPALLADVALLREFFFARDEVWGGEVERGLWEERGRGGGAAWGSLSARHAQEGSARGQV
jgi:hypothetical protein